MLRGRNTIATTAPTSDAIITPLTSVHRVDASPTPNNLCQSSDDSEDAFFGQLKLDFPDETISAVLLDKTTDTRSGLMDGQWCAMMTRHAYERAYSAPATCPKRAWSQHPLAQRYEVSRYLYRLFRLQYGQGYQAFEFRAHMEASQLFTRSACGFESNRVFE